MKNQEMISKTTRKRENKEDIESRVVYFFSNQQRSAVIVIAITTRYSIINHATRFHLRNERIANVIGDRYIHKRLCYTQADYSH